MKTRCPCCGAENSLDALIAHEQARQSMWTLANIGGPMTQGLVQYLGLFLSSSHVLADVRADTRHPGGRNPPQRPSPSRPGGCLDIRL